jgi:chlorite dismutase
MHDTPASSQAGEQPSDDDVVFGDHPIRVPHGWLADGDDAPRQFSSWSCYKVDPAWRRLPARERDAHIAELADVIEGWQDRIVMRTYSMMGIRADGDLMLWRATPDLEPLQQSATDIASTVLGTYLEPTYTFTATTKGSQYTRAAEQAGFRTRRPLAVTPTTKKYFIVYPFVKERRWYDLPAAERGEMMREHAMIGRQYPGVKLNTAFSFGLDDQEFMTAFETDSVHDFLDLMMELRHSRASQYTERDTPIFTAIAMSPRETLEALGGVRASVGATL